MPNDKVKVVRGEFSYKQARDRAVDALEIPDDDSFLGDFKSDEGLHDLASVLIHHCEEIGFIKDFKVICLWKQKGGKSSDGKLIFGKCVRLSGLVRHFAKADYVIWLAADNCNQVKEAFAKKRCTKDMDLAALMFHELKHIAQTDKGEAATQGHDWEVFLDEVERFGLWRDGMEIIATAFQQALFPGEGGSAVN